MHAEQPVWLFQLPGERAPTTRHMSDWFAAVLAEEGIQAPQGFAYLAPGALDPRGRVERRGGDRCAAVPG